MGICPKPTRLFFTGANMIRFVQQVERNSGMGDGPSLIRRVQSLATPSPACSLQSNKSYSSNFKHANATIYDSVSQRPAFSAWWLRAVLCSLAVGFPCPHFACHAGQKKKEGTRWRLGGWWGERRGPASAPTRTPAQIKDRDGERGSTHVAWGLSLLRICGGCVPRPHHRLIAVPHGSIPLATGF